jgi:hypothetical protein
MKVATLLFFTFSIIFISCTSDSKKTATEKESYEKTKESMKAKEEQRPSDFLFVEGHDKKNLLGQTVIKGTLVNKATVAIFKDIDVKLYFYSKTNALLETDKETVFEVLHPGETKDFKTKYFAPKGTDSVALDVLGAKVVAQ